MTAMSRRCGTDAVADAYDGVAERYASLFHDELDHRPDDRALLDRFVEEAAAIEPRRILDVGCGPGHVLDHVVRRGRRCGATSLGLDASRAMIDLARRRHRAVAVASSDALPVGTRSLSGVLSRHALIHTDPDRLIDSFSEFARVLVARGALMLTFSVAGVSGHGEAYPHAVATAYRWHPDVVASMLERTGFTEVARHDHVARPGDRFPHVSLFARRTSDDAVGLGRA